MRLSNKRKYSIYSFLMTLLAMLMLLGILGYFFEMYRLKILGYEEYLLLIIPAALLLIFFLRGRQIFEYDSDGEALNFKNRGISPIFGKSVSDEFPKYKLLKYEVVNAIIFKRLYITISSKKSHSITLKYDISYLMDKEIKDLKLSLNKVVKQNQSTYQKLDKNT